MVLMTLYELIINDIELIIIKITEMNLSFEFVDILYFIFFIFTSFHFNRIRRIELTILK